MHQECFQSYHASLVKSHCIQALYEGIVLNILLDFMAFLMLLAMKGSHVVLMSTFNLGYQVKASLKLTRLSSFAQFAVD